ncbi:MAG: hypothetical protein LQ348_003649 [Seirophora lacunosa]|nr:MAG: hypothetical protein LQ348_003649 [Seirophora lacunosa]
MRNSLRQALLAAGLLSSSGALAAGLTLTHKVAICPTGAGGLGDSGTVATVSSTYGVYTLLGCFAAPASGYVLDGRMTVNAGMTLESCASFCAGSMAFAVQNGQCLFYAFALTSAAFWSYPVSNKMSADAFKATNVFAVPTTLPHLKSLSEAAVPNALVMRRKTAAPAIHAFGSVSVTTFPTTLPNGVVSTVTSSTTLPPSPSGSVSVTTFTTTDSRGSQTVVTSSTTIPPPPPQGTTSVTTFTTTDSRGSQTVVTSSTTIPPPPPPGTTSVTTFTTTDSRGSQTVVTSSSVIVPPPSSTTSVTTFTTTDPNGSQTVVTSSSVIVPPPPGTTSATTFVTTDSAGSSITTTSTTVVPAPPVSTPATSLIVSSSTNAQGSVIVSTSTATAWPTSVCGGTYVDKNGQQYHVDCGITYPGFDLPSQSLPNIESCLDACTNYIPSPNVVNGASCVAVSYGFRDNGGECYLKYNVTEFRPAPGETSCYKIGSIRPPVSSPAGPAGPGTTPPSPPPSSNVNVPSPRPSATTSAGPINPAAAAQPCPRSNGQPFTNSQGTVFDITCSCSYPGNDLITPHYDTFEQCILACDNYVPDPNIAGGRGCVAATWGFGNPGGNCYLKYEIGQIVYGDPNAASCKLRDYTIPGSVSSLTTRIAATSSTVNPVPATTSSNPSVPQPSYISGTAECPAQNGAIYTDGFGVQYEIACGVEIDGANALSAAHADSFEKCVAFCDLLPGCTAATYPGEVGPDNLFRSNCYLYTSFNAYIPNANPTLRSARVRFGGSNTGDQFNSVGLCPALDGQTYTDPANGVHQIGCERGLAGAADLFAVVLHTLQACITYCSLYTTCVGVTFTGYVPGNRATNCNPRSTYTQVVAQAGNSTAFLSPP